MNPAVMNCTRSLAIACCLMVFVVGCSNDRIEVYPVSGTVTFNGAPMQGGGAIAFIPLTSQSGKGAGGTIDPDGNYVMSTYGDGDGSMPGEFRVVIHQTVWEEPYYGGDSDEVAKGNDLKPTEVVAAKDRIPTIYSNAQNSPLKVTVSPGENSGVNFELEPQ